MYFLSIQKTHTKLCLQIYQQYQETMLQGKEETEVKAENNGGVDTF